MIKCIIQSSRSKLLIFSIAFLLWMNINPYSYAAETKNLDSLLHLIQNPTSPEHEVDLLNDIAWGYFLVNQETYKLYAQKALEKSKKISYKNGEILAYSHLGWYYQLNGEIAQSFEFSYKAISLLPQTKNLKTIAFCNLVMGALYDLQKELPKAMPYYDLSYEAYKKLGDKQGMSWVLNNIGAAYIDLEEYDSAYTFIIQFNKIALDLQEYTDLSMGLNNLASIYFERGNLDSAKYASFASIDYAHKTKELILAIDGAMQLSKIHLTEQSYDSALFYTKKAELWLDGQSDRVILHDLSYLYAQIYKHQRNYELAHQFLEKYLIYHDSLLSYESIKSIGKVQASYEIQKKIEEEQRAKELAELKKQEEENRRNQLIYMGLFTLMISMFILLFALKHFNAGEKVIDAAVVFVLLLFFEFCILLIDPLLDSMVLGNPIYKLLSNLLLAIPLIPLHSWAEAKMRRWLLGTEK